MTTPKTIEPPTSAHDGTPPKWKSDAGVCGARAGLTDEWGPNAMEAHATAMWYEHLDALCAAVASSVARREGEDTRDAERWRALFGERVRVHDCTISGDGYQHLDLELWSHYTGIDDTDDARDRDRLTRYADAAQLARSPSPDAPETPSAPSLSEV